MQRTLTALISETPEQQPFVFLDGLPGRGASFTPAELQQLARTLNQIAIDAQQGARNVQTYRLPR